MSRSMEELVDRILTALDKKDEVTREIVRSAVEDWQSSVDDKMSELVKDWESRIADDTTLYTLGVRRAQDILRGIETDEPA